MKQVWCSTLRRLRIGVTRDHVTLKRRGGITVVGSLFQGGMRFVTNLLIGRLGGPLLLGSFSTAISTAQLLALLGPSSAGSAASKFVARELALGDAESAQAVAVHIKRRSYFLGVLLAASAFFVWVYVDAGSITDASIVAFMVVCYSGYGVARGFQYGAGNVKYAVKADIAVGVLSVLLVTILLLIGVRSLAILIPVGLGFLVYSLLGWPQGGQWARPPIAVRREVDGFIFVGSLGTLASAGYMNASVIISRADFGAVGAGWYSAGLALATPAALLASALSMVLFPAMAAAQSRGVTESVKPLTDNSLRLLLASMIALFGTLAMLSQDLVSLFWGPKFMETANFLPILFLAVMMNTVGVPCTTALTSGTQRGMLTSAASSMVGMAIGCVSWIALLPICGLLGVAAGYLLGTTIIAGVPLAIIWRRDRHNWTGLIVVAALGVMLICVGLILISQLSLSLPLRIVCIAAFLAIWLPVSGRFLRGGWRAQIITGKDIGSQHG